MVQREQLTTATRPFKGERLDAQADMAQRNEKNASPIEIVLTLDSEDPFFVAIPDSTLPTPEKIVAGLQRKAEELAKKIVIPGKKFSLIAPLFVGGKGRVLGERFVKLLQTQLIEQLLNQGITPEEAKKLIAESFISLFPGTALNISSSFFARIPEFEFLQHSEYSDAPENFLKELFAGKVCQPLEQMKVILSEALQDAQDVAGERAVCVLVLDDQLVSGMTADFTRILVSRVLERSGFEDLLRVEYELSLAENWSNLPQISTGKIIEGALSFKELFDQYLGISGASQYGEDELRRMSVPKREKPTGVIENIDVRMLKLFHSRVLGAVTQYVVRGGYLTSQEGDEPHILLQQADNHVLQFQVDCGRGLLSITIDVSKLVTKYNQELDRLVV